MAHNKMSEIFKKGKMRYNIMGVPRSWLSVLLDLLARLLEAQGAGYVAVGIPHEPEGDEDPAMTTSQRDVILKPILFTYRTFMN